MFYWYMSVSTSLKPWYVSWKHPSVWEKGFWKMHMLLQVSCKETSFLISVWCNTRYPNCSCCVTIELSLSSARWSKPKIQKQPRATVTADDISHCRSLNSIPDAPNTFSITSCRPSLYRQMLDFNFMEHTVIFHPFTNCHYTSTLSRSELSSKCLVLAEIPWKTLWY